MTLFLTSSSSLDWVICTAHKSLLLPSDDDDQNCFLFCCAQHFQTFRIPSMAGSGCPILTPLFVADLSENGKHERGTAPCGSSSFTSKIIVPSSSGQYYGCRREFQKTPSNNSSKLDGITHSYSDTQHLDARSMIFGSVDYDRTSINDILF